MRAHRKNVERLRVIKTARSLKAINKGVEAGFWPLVKPVNTNPPFVAWFGVYQDGAGFVREEWDPRSSFAEFGGEPVIPWQEYHLPRFKLPYAAYLVPKDLAPGTRVWLADLIEDFAGCVGVVEERLASAAATWNGKDFEVDYDFQRDCGYAIG